MTRKRNNVRKKERQKRKISDMIWELGGDFIRIAETVEQRQSRLNAVCSAWNMACNPPAQGKAMDQYMREYERLNANVDRANLASVRSNMEKLIQKKLEMFPGDLRQIVGAELVPLGNKDRIEVVSATFG